LLSLVTIFELDTYIEDI